MPGAYAHMTMVNFAGDPDELRAIPDFPDEAIRALGLELGFAELGSVSPDYPYLALADGGAARWADAMHYRGTVDVIRRGARIVGGMTGDARLKCLAWLLGYAAHVVGDVTIHPIVELKVGPFEENKTEHRVCELHQDSYIFQRMNLEGIGLAEHFRNNGIQSCSFENDPDRLDRDVGDLWRTMLAFEHPEEFADNPPDMDKWHGSFNLVLDKIASEGYRLFPFARHLGVDCGLLFPNTDEVESEYILDLATPTGVPMHYDDIFDQALKNIQQTWTEVARAVAGQGSALDGHGNWNLDTGKDLADGRHIFWRATA